MLLGVTTFPISSTRCSICAASAMQSCTSSSWSSAPTGLAQPGTAARIRGAICWTRISPACGLIFCFSFRFWNRPSDHGIAFVWRRPLRAGFCRPTNGESLQTLGSAGGLILKKWRLEKFGTTPGLPGVEAGPHRAPPASPDAVPGRSQKAPLTDLAERAPCPPKSSTGPAGGEDCRAALALWSRLQICSRTENGGRAWRTGRGLTPNLPLDMLPERRTVRRGAGASAWCGCVRLRKPMHMTTSQKLGITLAGVLALARDAESLSLPDADPRSIHPRCGGRESKFLAAVLDVPLP